MIGEMGVKPSDFEEMDFVEVEMMSDGFFKNREFELAKTRKIMWAVIQSQSTKKVNETDIMELSFDKQQEQYDKEEMLTSEDIANLKKRIKWHNK